jgi:hypothetical protein
MSRLMELESRVKKLEDSLYLVIGILAEEVVIKEPEQEVEVSGVPYKVSLAEIGEGKRRS